MTKALLEKAKAKAKVEKRLKKCEINRKQAIQRQDANTELCMDDKIEDCNTILWALEISQIAARDGFECHILERFTKIN